MRHKHLWFIYLLGAYGLRFSNQTGTFNLLKSLPEKTTGSFAISTISVTNHKETKTTEIALKTTQTLTEPGEKQGYRQREAIDIRANDKLYIEPQFQHHPQGVIPTHRFVYGKPRYSWHNANAHIEEKSELKTTVVRVWTVELFWLPKTEATQDIQTEASREVAITETTSISPNFPGSLSTSSVPLSPSTVAASTYSPTPTSQYEDILPETNTTSTLAANTRFYNQSKVLFGFLSTTATSISLQSIPRRRRKHSRKRKTKTKLPVFFFGSKRRKLGGSVKKPETSLLFIVVLCSFI